MQVSGTKKRIYGLDILRALAILFVVQMHGLEFIRPHLQQVVDPIFLGPHPLVHYYWLLILDGVDLFFVLSGFLIGGILIRTIEEGGFSWAGLRKFWIRRWFRTLPNYFLVLLVLTLGYFYAFGAAPPQFSQFLVFLQNFNSPHPDFFPEAWSLSIEEWFYVLVPLLLLLAVRLSRNKSAAILSCIAIVLIGATLFRLYKVYSFDALTDGAENANMRKLVLTRLDSVSFGFLGAYLASFHKVGWLRHKKTLFWSGLLLLFGSRLAASESTFYHNYIYLSAQSAGTLMLLPAFSSIRSGKGALYRIITFVSLVSYSVYLLNYTIVLKIIMPALVKATCLNYNVNAVHGILAYCLFWTISILGSWLLYRFYEKPVMDLRKKIR